MIDIYLIDNKVRVIKVPIELFKLVWFDKPKFECKEKNFINANFFAPYSEIDNNKTIYFTLPVGHLICDINWNSENIFERKYQLERGTVINNNKFIFDSSKWSFDNPTYCKEVSTFIVYNDNKFEIKDIKSLDNYKYAISGVPCLKDGNDVKWYDYSSKQGWNPGTVRPAYHNFIGTKYNDYKNIYLMQYDSKKSNLIYSAEFYNIIKDSGFKDIIKLDGGGSYICKCDKINEYDGENRRINCIITFNEEEEDYKTKYNQILYENIALVKEIESLKGIIKDKLTDIKNDISAIEHLLK